MSPSPASTLQTYVSDAHSLQKHILEAIERQVADEQVQKQAQVHRLLDEVCSTLRRQVDGLEQHLESLGGKGLLSRAKEAVGSALGLAAGAIGKGQRVAVSKMLRDDFTALHLSAMSLTMLHATALGLHDSATARTALHSLAELIPLAVQIGERVPAAVILELADAGLSVDQSAAEQARQNSHRAWSRDGGQSGSRGGGT